MKRIGPRGSAPATVEVHRHGICSRVSEVNNSGPMAANGVDSRLFHVRGQLSYRILHAQGRTGRSDLDHRNRRNNTDDGHDDHQLGHPDSVLPMTRKLELL